VNKVGKDGLNGRLLNLTRLRMKCVDCVVQEGHSVEERWIYHSSGEPLANATFRHREKCQPELPENIIALERGVT
jgi:hypothetical protein